MFFIGSYYTVLKGLFNPKIENKHQKKKSKDLWTHLIVKAVLSVTNI